MAEIIGFPSNNKPPVAVDTVRRDDAVARVRALEEQISAAEGSACIHRMAQGDVLIPIRNSAAHGRWLAFLKDCTLSVRNAQIAIQLAENREQIEAANAKSDSHLSIAAALRLIRPEKPPPRSEPPEPTTSVAPSITADAVIAWLASATQEDKRRVGAALAADVRVMKRILPGKQITHKATHRQILEKALGLMVVDTTDGAPAH